MNSIDKLASEMVKTIRGSLNKKTSAYDTQAEVIRVDGNTAWVHIPGGVAETPVQMTTTAKKGDSVQVRVSGGQAWLTGNSTAPPTDDTTAIKAETKADNAYAVSEMAIKDAQRASEAAEQAETSANSAMASASAAQTNAQTAITNAAAAQSAADTAITNAAAAQSSADTAAANAQTAMTNAAAAQTAAATAETNAATALSAAQTATSILDDMEDAAEEAHTSLTGIYADAETAKTNAQTAITNAAAAQTAANAAQDSATNANAYASRALGNLASVQSVTETLNWITEHGTMAITTDTDLDPTHVYFVLDDTDGYYRVGQHYYNIVTEPNVADISSYYELSIDQSLNNYVGTHLAVDEEGLWILPVNISTGSYRVLIAVGGSTHTYSNAGMYIIDDSGKVIAKYIDHIVLGIDDGTQSYLYLDYHSMQAIDKDSNVYFHISDLRNRNDNWLAPIIDTFIGDGSTTTFRTGSNASYVTSVTIDNVETTDYTVTGNQDYFTFTTAPADGSKIVISYKTNSNLAKAYTLGVRQYNSNVGAMSLAEGLLNAASGPRSHAEGTSTTAEADSSHAEGAQTNATGIASHAEGMGSEASGDYSHAQNRGTIASQYAQTAIGRYNTESGHALIIGNGSIGHRSNAFTVDWNGDVEASGDITDGTGNVLSDKADSSVLPTKVSDLQNDSGFIDSSALPTKISDLQNDSGFISTETDPIFTASPAYGIASNDISNWNAKADAFFAEYGTTTFDEITAAIGNGDVVYVEYSSYIAPLVKTTSSSYIFSMTYDPGSINPQILRFIVDSSDAWTWNMSQMAFKNGSYDDDLIVKSSDLDRTRTTNPTSSILGKQITFTDNNDAAFGEVIPTHNANGTIQLNYRVNRTINGTNQTNAFVVGINPDGSNLYWATDKPKFRSDMGCNSATNLTEGTLPAARLPVMFKVTTAKSSTQTINYNSGKAVTITAAAQSGYDLVGVVGVTSNHQVASSLGAAYVSSQANRQITVYVTNRNTSASGNFTDMVVTVYCLWALSNIY